MEGNRSEREGGGLRRVARRGAIVLAWLALWQLAALAVGNALLLCGPAEAAAALARNLADPAFWTATARSFERIALGFAAACALGLAAGAAAARWASVRDFLAPLLHVVKSTPVVCIIALLLVGAGANRATSLVVGLVVAPPFYFAALEARGARDRALDEMLAVFSVPRLRRWTCVRWPEAAPFLRAAAKTAVGMAWKAGVAAELIGLPARSIGEHIYLAKLSLDTADIIAWTVVVIALGWLCEKAVVALIDALARLPRLLLRERPDGGSHASPSAPAPSPAAGASAGGPATAPAPDSMPGARVQLSGVAKSFGDHLVLDDLSLDVEPGGRLCVMAPSGTGKTTLLRLVAGLERPDAGAVQVQPPRVSMVFQEPRLVEELTGRENLALTARDPAERARGTALVDALLPDAPGLLDRPVAQLSGGQRRRIELARALAHDAALVILDEPFASLDDASREAAARLALQALGSRTLVIATHHRGTPEALRARILTLN